MTFKGRIGTYLTVAVVLLGLNILRHREFIRELTGLAPNEIGDFLAGIFAPIALGWVVLGYYQQGQELKANTEALRLQAEEANKHTEAFNSQLELLTSQLNAQESNIFLGSYPIRFNELANRASSIVRATVENDQWQRNQDLFGKGYTDVFANLLKNEIARMQKEEFLALYDKSFSDNRFQLYYYADTFETFLDDAEAIDINIRRVIEMSGLGAAYLSICELIDRRPGLNFRQKNIIERTPLRTSTGTKQSKLRLLFRSLFK